MKTIFDNSEVFNHGVETLGLKVARIWSRMPGKGACASGVDKLNPYTFGDLPISWTVPFQDCLYGTFCDASRFYPPPKNTSIARGDFLCFGGQYGEVYFGRNVTFFIEGILGEVDLVPGEAGPAVIAVPSVMFLEFLSSAVEAMKKGVKSVECKSTFLRDVTFTARFTESYPMFNVSATIDELRLCEDGNAEPIQWDRLNQVVYGEISVPEALTIGAVTKALSSVSIAEREVAAEFAKSGDLSSSRNRQRRAMCNDLVLTCTDSTSFLLPPGFLSSIHDGGYATLPPVAVPTGELIGFLVGLNGLG